MSARRREGGERGRLVAPRRDGALWWTTFLVVWALASLWAAASPLAGVPDEPAHVGYAVSLVRGQLGTDVSSADPDAPPALQVLGLRHDYRVTVPAWAAQLNQLPSCYMFAPDYGAACSPELTASTRPTTTYTPVGRYEPLYYALVGLPSLVLSGPDALHAMRVVSAALCAALTATAMVAAAGTVRRRGLAVLGVALAVTPLAFFLFGAVNPSGFEIAAGIAAWATLLDLWARPGPVTTPVITRTALCCSTFVLVRPLGPLYLALAAGVVLLAAARPGRLRELLASTAGRVAAGAVALASAAAVAWILVMKPENGLLGHGVAGLSLGESLRGSWDRIATRTDQLVGVFGWLDTVMPRWVYDTWLGMVALVVVVALVVGRWRQRAAVLVALALAVILPLFLEATRVPSVGFIWQGRYTLPLAAGLTVVAAWVVAERLRAPHRVLLAWSTTYATVIAGLQLVAHATALDRYVVGLPTPLFSYLTRPGWRPPLGPWGQLLAGTTFAVAWGAVIAWAGGLRWVSSGPGTTRARPRSPR